MINQLTNASINIGNAFGVIAFYSMESKHFGGKPEIDSQHDLMLHFANTMPKQ